MKSGLVCKTVEWDGCVRPFYCLFSYEISDKPLDIFSSKSKYLIYMYMQYTISK